MKKCISAIIICLYGLVCLVAQDRQQVSSSATETRVKVDSLKVSLQSDFAWNISPRLGERIPAEVPRDSTTIGYHQKSLADGKDVAVGYTGNIGSAGQSKIFFNRPDASRFVFLDPYYYWNKTPENHKFFNTKVPYSEIYYQSAGGGETKEERLKAQISTNFGKKLNVGFNFDYLYARGFYLNSSNKQVNYDFYGSYIGDKYKLHVYLANNNYTTTENGGISDPAYITNPDSDSLKAINFTGKSMDIPVRIKDHMWNKLRGRHLFMSNRYDIGNDMEQYAVNDSVMRWRRKQNYISPASLILTTHYKDQRRRVQSDGNEMDLVYNKYYTDINGTTANSPKYTQAMNDYMSYWSLKNTLALSMNEGFRPWMKFGLAAFVEYDYRKYLYPHQNYFGADTIMSDNSFIVGGVISSSKGKHLEFRGLAEKDLNNSDYKFEGNVKTKFNLGGKGFSLNAEAYHKNISSTVFQNSFSSKYWRWNAKETLGSDGFNSISRTYIGGEIESALTQTKISGGVENIKNYIYYRETGLPAQERENIQVLSLRLDQKLSVGKFHWDNQIVFQQASNDTVIALPMLSLYSDLYFKTKIAKVLTFQLGVDVKFHTQYYASGYEPLTMQFYNQQSYEIGNFPLATAYINIHMKHARFFVMMYNVAQGVGNSNQFSLYRYPTNPRTLKLGLSWYFNN